MTVLLVRHARAGRRSAWKGDDRLRPLSKRGRAQADGLVDVLSTCKGAALISSPWVRSIQTLEPLARAAGVEVQVDDILGEGMAAKAWDLYRGCVEGRHVVLCTHGDVIDAVLARLTSEGFDLDAPPRAAKGAVWVIENHTAHYLPPPS